MDVVALTEDTDQTIMNNIKWFSDLYKINVMDHLADAYKCGVKTAEYQTKKGHYLHSKLHFIQDKAGKTRVVAQADLVTQSMLKPIHRFFAQQLERHVTTDYTHNQDSGRKAIVEACRKGGLMFSFDLSNATDLLPRDLVIKVTSPILGDELAQKWVSLMCDREFTYVRYEKL